MIKIDGCKISKIMFEEIQNIKKDNMKYGYDFIYRDVFKIFFDNGILQIKYKDYCDFLVLKDIGRQKSKFINWLIKNCFYLDYIIDQKLEITNKIVYVFYKLNREI